MEGTSPLTISCRVARQRAINFSEFYDSPRQRYARFTAKVEESFARSLARAQESFVRPFARLLAAKRATGSTAGGCGVSATAGIDMHCPRLSSPCFPSLHRQFVRDALAFSDPVRLPRRVFPLADSLPFAPPQCASGFI